MPKRKLSKRAKKQAQLETRPPMNFKNPALDILAWKKPDTKEKHLDDLVAANLLPEKAIGDWRAPEDDAYPGAGG
jgi:hypothetical protein